MLVKSSFSVQGLEFLAIIFTQWNYICMSLGYTSSGLVIPVISISKNVFFINACRDIGLSVKTRKTKYMEVGSHRGMIANAHIKIGSNSYEKMMTLAKHP